MKICLTPYENIENTVSGHKEMCKICPVPHYIQGYCISFHICSHEIVFWTIILMFNRYCVRYVLPYDQGAYCATVGVYLLLDIC